MIAIYKLLSEERCWLAVGSFVVILEKDGSSFFLYLDAAGLGEYGMRRCKMMEEASLSLQELEK